MELDRIRLTTQERKRRTDNNLCLACGEGGHYARDYHRKENPVPMPRPQENQQHGRSRGYGRGYGRGNSQWRQSSQQQQPAQQQPIGNWQWVPQQPLQQQFLQPQLYAIQPGYVIDEATESTTGSTAGDSQVLEDQLNGAPLN